MGRIFVEYMLFHVANGEQYWSAILVTPVAGTINNRCKIITGHSLVTSWLERALNSRGFLRLDSTPRGFIVRWNGLLSPRGSHIVAFSPTRCDNENNASWNGEPTIVFFFSLSLSVCRTAYRTQFAIAKITSSWIEVTQKVDQPRSARSRYCLLSISSSSFFFFSSFLLFWKEIYMHLYTKGNCGKKNLFITLK